MKVYSQSNVGFTSYKGHEDVYVSDRRIPLYAVPYQTFLVHQGVTYWWIVPCKQLYTWTPQEVGR